MEAMGGYKGRFRVYGIMQIRRKDYKLGEFAGLKIEMIFNKKE